MGVYMLIADGGDSSVAPPNPTEVLVGNSAATWQPRRLDDPEAFPYLRALLARIEALELQMQALAHKEPETPPTRRSKA